MKTIGQLADDSEFLSLIMYFSLPTIKWWDYENHCSYQLNVLSSHFTTRSKGFYCRSRSYKCTTFWKMTLSSFESLWQTTSDEALWQCLSVSVVRYCFCLSTCKQIHVNKTRLIGCRQAKKLFISSGPYLGLD